MGSIKRVTKGNGSGGFARCWRCFGALPLLWLVTQGAFAACNFVNGYGLQSVMVAVPSFSLPRDPTVGQVLTSYSPSPTVAYGGTNQNFASCSTPTPYYYNASVAGGKTFGGSTNVYQTNIPGIGLRFYRRNNIGGSNSYFTDNTGSPSGTDNSTVNWNWNNGSTRYWGAEVVVTGPVGSGTYNGTTDTGQNLYGFAQLQSLVVTTIHVNSFSVTAWSCQALSKTVNLGRHATSEFPAKGSTAGLTDFSIDLSGCPASGLSSISYTLTPTLVVDAVNGVIGTDSFTGAATGLGVKVMDGNGNPAAFNTAKAVTYTAGQSNLSIPFKAALYRTVAPPTNITPGVVRASMAFTMTYK